MTASVLNKIQKLERLKGTDIYYDNAKPAIVQGNYNNFTSNKQQANYINFSLFNSFFFLA